MVYLQLEDDSCRGNPFWDGAKEYCVNPAQRGSFYGCPHIEKEAISDTGPLTVFHAVPEHTKIQRRGNASSQNQHTHEWSYSFLIVGQHTVEDYLILCQILFIIQA